jgi:hypothetical protein
LVSKNKKIIGGVIVLFILLILVLFGDVIVPTLTSSPIKFDVSEGVNVDPDSSTSNTGRSCVIYPNDPGC